VFAGFFLRPTTRREDISLHEPSSSDRKTVAPLEPSRWCGGPTDSNIAQVNKWGSGNPSGRVAFDQTAAKDSLRDGFRAIQTV